MVQLNTKLSDNDINCMWNDILKIFTVLIIINFLSYIVDDAETVFDDKFFKLLLYTAIGIFAYYFIVKQYWGNNEKFANRMTPLLINQQQQQPCQQRSYKQQSDPDNIMPILKKPYSKSKKNKVVRFRE